MQSGPGCRRAESFQWKPVPGKMTTTQTWDGRRLQRSSRARQHVRSPVCLSGCLRKRLCLLKPGVGPSAHLCVCVFELSPNAGLLWRNLFARRAHIKTLSTLARRPILKSIRKRHRTQSILYIVDSTYCHIDLRNSRPGHRWLSRFRSLHRV